MQERHGSIILVVVVVIIGSLVLCGYSLANPAPTAGSNSSLVTTSPTPITITTPVYPGMGAPIDELNGRHPSVRGDAAIQEYIRECGVGRWSEQKMDTGYISVHIPPGNSCGKQLVFTTRSAGGYDGPTQIIDTWIIGANETWSISMDTVNPGGGSSRVRPQTKEERKAQDSLVLGAVVILVILGVAFALIDRRKR